MIDFELILKNVGRHVELDGKEMEHFISLLKFRRLPGVSATKAPVLPMTS